MKKTNLIILILALFTTVASSQSLTQTVRGTIIDTDTNLPLIGATIIIQGSDPLIGTTTDVSGNYRFENVPIGRITLQLSYLGYESKTVASIVVNSGKEVILNLSLQESTVAMDEVVVEAFKNNGETTNDLSLISARSISPEETDRHPGSFSDPSRILSNFAGVTNSQNGSNDIIVRGNAPKYVQWRLEGVEITNPNHFEDQNSSSGGINALNNSLLDVSDFYTGAFSPEYGNVLSGVYDVKLRAGNNERFESIFGLGLFGIDFTAEGPFKKGYAGSYLVNYRYSTISLINDLGLVDVGGIPRFQDATFKVNLPTQKYGTFSLFGLAGLNNLSFTDVQRNTWVTPGDRSLRSDIVEDLDVDNYLFNTGINHTYIINKQSYLKTALSFSANGISNDIYESQIVDIADGQGGFVPDTVGRALNYTSDIITSTYRGAITYNNKINAQHKFQVGAEYALFNYDNDQSMLDDDTANRISLVAFNGYVATLRSFVTWKYRLNDDLTFVAGVHNMNVLSNKKSTLEPRIAMNWQLNERSSIHAGYGNHSTMERIHNYTARVEQPDGSFREPNKDLGLLKAHHYVLGYQNRITENVMAKIEVYYQDLYNLPVENDENSFYATINEGLEYRYVDLVNEGTGKNYGIEATVERFFTDNYYFLANASLYESKYTALDGVERNTRYNGNYLVNVLFGKDFVGLGRRNNHTLSLNAKVFFAGGKKIISLLRDADGNLAVDPENNQYWDYENAYKNKLEDVYQVVLSASYKFNVANATHEIFLNLDNVTNNKGKISEYYDANEPNSIGYNAQFGFFPNLMYRVYF